MCSDLDDNSLEDGSNREKKKNTYMEIIQWLLVIIVAFTIPMLVRTYLYEPVKVEGESMQNTLQTGQRLVIYKLGYRFSLPRRGDIVVLKYQEGYFKNSPFINPGEVDYIKRVVALPGEMVDIKNGLVYINGKELDEPYAYGSTNQGEMNFPIRVPEKSIFVLGDNRQNSKDSRQIGFMDLSRIKGKVVLRIWPLYSFGVVH